MTAKKLMSIPAFVLFVAVPSALSQGRLTSPQEQFGFEIGADYMLVNYTQLLAYWQRLDRESDRLTLQTIGTTAEGRTMVMAVVTSPANHQKLTWYRDISRR